MSRWFVGVLTASFMLLLGSGAGFAADDRLTVTQDESAMERTIESYLTTVHKLTITEKTEAGDDLTLNVPFKGDPMPSFRIVIDTQAANRDKDTNQILERTILTNLYTTIKVPQERRAAVLEVLNDFNRKKIFACAYIDTDGEIVCGWNLNVLEVGLPTEYVYDAVVRVQKIWTEAYPDVSKALS